MVQSPPRSRSTRGAPGRQPVRSRRQAVAAHRPLDLERLAAQWQLALDAADRAVAASRLAPHTRLEDAKYKLGHERRDTAALLARVAGDVGVHPAPWLAPVQVTTSMLGLPPTTAACLFDLDGVLTDSGALHARAWAEVFDDFLMRVSEKSGWPVAPFDLRADYAAYIAGRPRLEGIHQFLASRGMQVPEGRVGDPANADTANGLATHKREAFARTLRERGVSALPGARRYLEAAGRAGLKRGVVSASASTARLLERAHLDGLVEACVDADVIQGERLPSRPAPDVLIAACRQLDVQPAETVTFTATPAGVAGGHAGGLEVIGVAEGEAADVLGGFGADRVVTTLGQLLDPRLTDPV